MSFVRRKKRGEKSVLKEWTETRGNQGWRARGVKKEKKRVDLLNRKKDEEPPEAAIYSESWRKKSEGHERQVSQIK